MNVLVINSGSSSVKFQLFKMPDEKLLASGRFEKANNGKGIFNFRFEKREVKRRFKNFNYKTGIHKILKELILPENCCIKTWNEIGIVGHRLIHGAEIGGSCVEITETLLNEMKLNVSLAPLHYPANIEGIEITKEQLPGVMQLGVFDTAFHQTLPAKAFLYGIPLKWYKEHRIRKYGFHGTSHKYVSQAACKLTGLELSNSKIISCHLGNGASVTAIKNGISVDTSMGMTPVEGLLMGSRCGDIDAGVLLHIQQNFDLSVEQMQSLVNKEGGLLGLSGISSDFRKVSLAARNGDKNAQLALEVYTYRILKYIGSYLVVLGGVDLIIFTGGLGENDAELRKNIGKNLEFLGIKISELKNSNVLGKENIISSLESKVFVVVVQTNEELMIARDIYQMAISK